MKPVHILIVDSSEPWRRAVCSMLAEDNDLEVVGESSDGMEAVRMSEKLQPDMVLLDIQLLKMSGLEAAGEVRKVSPATKIVFVSEYHCLETMREALRVGVGFVVKADAARDLLSIVRGIIRNEPFVRFRFLNGDPSNTDQI